MGGAILDATCHAIAEELVATDTWKVHLIGNKAAIT